MSEKLVDLKCGLCPNCGKTVRLEKYRGIIHLHMDSLTLPAVEEFWRCSECHEECTDATCLDPLEQAYKDYEALTGKPWKGMFRNNLTE